MATIFDVAFTGLVAMVHPSGWDGHKAAHMTAVLMNTSYSNMYSMGTPALEDHFPRITVPVRLGSTDASSLTVRWDPNLSTPEITSLPDSQGHLVQYATWDLMGSEVSFPGATGSVDTANMTELFSFKELGVSDVVFSGYRNWPVSLQGTDKGVPVSSLVRIQGGALSTSDDDSFGVERGSQVILKAKPMAVALRWDVAVDNPKIHIKQVSGREFDIEFVGNPNWTVPIEITNVCHCNVPASDAPPYHFRAIYDLLSASDRPTIANRLIPDKGQLMTTKPGPLTHCVPQASFSE